MKELEEAREALRKQQEETDKIVQRRDQLEEELEDYKSEARARDADTRENSCQTVHMVTSRQSKMAESLNFEAKNAVLEHRNHILTEDVDELRRDNERLRAENDINNCWVDKQDELREALEKADQEKLEKEQRIYLLEEKLQSLNQKQPSVKPAQKRVLDEPVSERQHWSKTTFQVYFKDENIKSSKDPQ